MKAFATVLSAMLCIWVSGVDTTEPQCFAGKQVPEWLIRTDFSFELDDHAKPRWEVETIQPFYQTPCSLRHTLYWQGRVSNRGGHDDTYNIGIGYRYLGCCQDWLLGTNAFFDSTRKHKHQRVGAGLEALYRQFTLRANYYRPTTGKMTAKTSGGVRTTEEALEGWDAELESPFPYLPWVRVGLNYYHWEGDFFKNLDGFRGTLNLNITNNIQIEAGRAIDNHFHNNFIRFIFNFGRKREVEYTLCDCWRSYEIFAPRNLCNWTLAKVKRHNEIVVERVKHGTTTSGVIIGRGD